MKQKVCWDYCYACHRSQPSARVLPKFPDNNPFPALFLFPLAVLIFVLRLTFLPDRCVVCFRWKRTIFRRRITPSNPQSAEEINRRLSPFSKRTFDYTGDQTERIDEASTGSTLLKYRGHTERYLASGYPVGGRYERVVHVTQLQPRAAYEGYVARFFYLLFLPVTYWHYRHRLGKDSQAHFFPPNYPYAGRIVVTDKRLFLCYGADSYYFYHHSFPIDAIREVRQSGPCVVVQPCDPNNPAVTAHVGAEVGELLMVLHGQTTIAVRDPDGDWPILDADT